MLKKKNYDKGFVSRVKGSLFSSADTSLTTQSNKSEQKWGLKKSKKFSRLDGYEEDESLLNVVSADSQDSNEKLPETLLANGFDMLPFQEQAFTTSPAGKRKSGAAFQEKKEKKKKRRNGELLASPEPKFASGSLNFESITGEPEQSMQLQSKKVTAEKKNDDGAWTTLPSNNFFSSTRTSWIENKKGFTNPFSRSKKNGSSLSELTEGNLKALAFSEDDIENSNPRSDFVQFTIDAEDKASTVILASGNSFEEKEDHNSDDESDVHLNDFGFKVGGPKKPHPGRYLAAKMNDTTPIHGAKQSFDFKVESKEKSQANDMFMSFEAPFQMGSEWGTSQSETELLKSKKAKNAPPKLSTHQSSAGKKTAYITKSMPPPRPVPPVKAKSLLLPPTVGNTEDRIESSNPSEAKIEMENSAEHGFNNDIETSVFSQVPKTQVKRVPLSPLVQRNGQQDFKSNLEFFQSQTPSTTKKAVSNTVPSRVPQPILKDQPFNCSSKMQTVAEIAHVPSFDSYSDSEDGGDYYFTSGTQSQKENVNREQFCENVSSNDHSKIKQNEVQVPGQMKVARLGAFANSNNNVGVLAPSNESDRPKVTGLPNNAIAASMLFRTSYNIDTDEVDAKLRSKEKVPQYRRDSGGVRGRTVPHSIGADDTVSVVSSFSDETALVAVNPWRQRSQNLLNYMHANNKVRSTNNHPGALYEA